MRQTRAAALLWAYDIGSRFGIAWRPRTILMMLGMVAVLGLVPALALALWVGRLLNAVQVFLPWAPSPLLGRCGRRHGGSSHENARS